MAEPNTFTGAEIDKAADGRRTDDAWVEAQRSDPAARAVVLGDAGLRVDGDRVATVPLSEAGGGEPVLLGVGADGPLWAVDADPSGDEPKRARLIGAIGPRDIKALEGPDGWIGIREAAASLSQADGGLAAYATGLLNFHRSHRFCPNCGAGTVHTEAGLVRSCPRCRTQVHPSPDPVVIMLVVGPEGALLGRQPTWPERRYSALAGFVGPGESLEEAVAREVEEEAGVAIGEPRYVSSQPWPFPASLMLGFIAPWTGGEPGGADAELEDVRWFSRETIADAATREDDWTGDPGDGVEVQLPPRTAIARRLVERWLEETAG